MMTAIMTTCKGKGGKEGRKAFTPSTGGQSEISDPCPFSEKKKKRGKKKKNPNSSEVSSIPPRIQEASRTAAYPKEGKERGKT